MAGPGRRRLDISVRLFRLAVRDLRATATAPEEVDNLGVQEEAMAPPPPPPPLPRLDIPRSSDTEKTLKETQKRTRADSGEGGTGKKRPSDPVGSQGATGKRRRGDPVGAQGSRLSADTLFKGKPTGAGESIFSSGDIEAGSSAGHPKTFNNVVQLQEDKCAGKTELSPDAAQKAKNDIEIQNFLAEMEDRFGLDVYRQKYAVNYGLPLPPPSWDRVPTPPIPSSPPPAIIKINNCEEANKAIKAWSNGSNVQLQISEHISLSIAEKILNTIKEARADRIVLNLSTLESKALHTRLIRERISHSMGEIERYERMLSLPWIPDFDTRL